MQGWCCSKERVSSVLPYFHRVSHNSENVVNSSGMSVAFFALCKLGSLCLRILSERNSISDYVKRYATPFVMCLTGVMYEVPLTWGHTGRCLNDWLRKHQFSIKTKTGSNLPLHSDACPKATCNKPCLPLLAKAEAFRRSCDHVARKPAEAFFTRNKDDCVWVTHQSIFMKKKAGVWTAHSPWCYGLKL